MTDWNTARAELSRIHDEASRLRAGIFDMLESKAMSVSGVTKKVVGLLHPSGAKMAWEYDNGPQWLHVEPGVAPLLGCRTQTRRHSGRRTYAPPYEGPAIEISDASDIDCLDRLGNSFIDLTIDHWVQLFRIAFPGFERFDLNHPQFEAEERTAGPANKQAAMEFMQSRLPDMKDAQAATDLALSVIRRSHLNSFTQMIFSDALSNHPDECGRAILELLKPGPGASDLESAVRTIAPFAVRKDSGKPDREATRSSLQTMLMYADPDTWIDINQERRSFCSRSLYAEDAPSPEDVAGTATCDLRIGRDVMEGLRKRGLAPRDMIDVHGFLWAVFHESKASSDHSSELSTMEIPMVLPQNLILYGPPGTGKTYHTAAEALRLCGEPVPGSREEVMAAYARLRAEKRIEFVTFHQSMSYEDFIEGRQPVTGSDDGESGGAGFRLETVPGIFRTIADRAAGRRSTKDRPSFKGRGLWRFPLTRSDGSPAEYREDCLKHGKVRAHVPEDIDLSDDAYAGADAIISRLRKDDPDIHQNSWRAVEARNIRVWMRPGDVVIAVDDLKRVVAAGIIESGYLYDKSHLFPGASSYRTVKWTWRSSTGRPISDLTPFRVGTHMLHGMTVHPDYVAAIEELLAEPDDGPPPAHVLIIDEINRANISKVFGELITLIEPDKRLTMPNALKVRLPYSCEDFGVPANLHILGTMNTADRSIALLDTALRRRFEFREIMPKPEALSNAAERCGIDLPRLLRTLNERIEYLYDREHQIGHAYFINCTSRDDVDEVMRHKVIPLLAEYFFEDWSKVAAVLGDADGSESAIEGGFLTRSVLKPPPGLDDDGDGAPRFRWTVRRGSFDYGRLAG